MRGIFGRPDGRPVHDFVEAHRHQGFFEEALLLVVTEPAAAMLIGRVWHRGAGRREYLERRAGAARGEPEFKILRAVHIGEFVARLARPSIAARQDQRRLPFRRQMRTFDMLMDFAETGRREESW